MPPAALYFAYGSNLLPSRMRERVPSASARGAARLAGFRLTLDKRGSDDSGKANLAAAPGELVWGAVYALDPRHWPRLDGFEPGYERLVAEVELGEQRVAVHLYRSLDAVANLAAHAWYKRCIVDGARAHGLPANWLAFLETLPAKA